MQYFSDFSDTGGLAVISFTIVTGVLAIVFGHLYALKHPDKELKLFLKTGDKDVSLKNINLICFISLFLFDWLYSWAFDFFGKKKFIYPVLLTIIATLAGIAEAAGPGGDAEEFIFYGAIPMYITIHCLGWLHVNMVYIRLKKDR